ncbi:unnamed protein product [Victoria cruziana]
MSKLIFLDIIDDTCKDANNLHDSGKEKCIQVITEDIYR